MQSVEQIIQARWIIPMQPDANPLEHHSVVIDDGKIVMLAASDEVAANFQAGVTTTLDHHVLIPGLINAHTHAAMSLMRGLADDLPLMTWLNEHIWPAESRWVSEDFVRVGSEYAIAEMIRCGVTCFNDMYFFPDVTAAVAEAAGMRACVGLIVLDFPTVWARDWRQYIDKALAVHERYRDSDLVHTALAPHAPYSTGDDALTQILEYSDKLRIPIHIHVHETRDEIETLLASKGARPLRHLQKLGLLTQRLIAVHMTQLEDEEIALFAASGAHVVHCPQSNMKLASGFCPLQKLHDAGVNVALGTDGAASNNDLDMLAEMQSAAMLGKVVAGDASAATAQNILAMATINGARALGIDDVTGSLSVGKAADITAIDLSELETRPLYHPLSQIVYAADRRQVTHVWCQGKLLLRDRQLQTLDIERLLADADRWQAKLAG